MNSSFVSFSGSSSVITNSTGSGDANYLTSEQYNKFLSVINEKPFFTNDTPTGANMAGIPLFRSYNSTVNHQIKEDC